MKLIFILFLLSCSSLLELFCVAINCSISFNQNVELINKNSSQVFRTYPINENQIQQLQNVRENYDFWSPPRKCGPTDVFVSRHQKIEFLNYLKNNKIQFEVYTPPIPKYQTSHKNKIKSKDGSFDWKNYHNFNTIQKWLDNMAKDYSNASKTIIIGQSLENRPLKLMKIGLPNPNGKKSIWIDGGIHARGKLFGGTYPKVDKNSEPTKWATPPTACYIINELLTKSENSKFLTDLDIYVIPVLNPDGYEFSRSKDRYWRKNRSKNKNAKGGCRGVDLNRNFGFTFGGPGSSKDRCTEIYRGPKAFSEPESRAVKNFVENNKSANWEMYISLHTFSQMILTPSGKNKQRKDFKEINALAVKAAAALKKSFGTKFQVGSGTDLLGPAGGCSDDWAKGSGHFKYSYTLELRDTGRFGFLLPANQILPTSKETFEAFKVFANALLTPRKKI